MAVILPEEIVVQEIEKFIESQGYWYMKTHGDRFGKSGIPDIIVCVNGHFVSFEVKRHSGGVASPLQKYNEQKIKTNNGICEFITDSKVAIDIMKEVDSIEHS